MVIKIYNLESVRSRMLKKLFYTDPYLMSCDARVVALSGKEVQLDQTVFFAFSGGQASDRGVIDNIPVERAVVVDDDIIYHPADEPRFRVGDTVNVTVNARRRLMLMRLHSAAHVVHFLFSERTGVSELIGSNIDEDKARLDCAYAESVADLLPDLQKKAHDICLSNLSITVVENDGIRTWSCSSWSCFCTGTHVRSTREIGSIALKRKNIGAGKERIEITLQE